MQTRWQGLRFHYLNGYRVVLPADKVCSDTGLDLLRFATLPLEQGAIKVEGN